MTEAALYTYRPIPANHIRLLQFVQDADPLSAIVEAFSLEEPLPVYRSISYAWAPDGGELQKDYHIEIDKQKLPILNPLWQLFKALQSRNMLLDGSWWWIDSICIDQTNYEERADQVRCMEVIYRLAKNAIVWLGEPSADSELAMDFIDLLDETCRRKLSVGEIRATLQQDHHRAQWDALTNYLSRRWWSRIWTVQEFVLARNLSFWCGARDVDRVAVCNSLSVADKCTSVGIKETLAFRHGHNRRRIWLLYQASRKPGSRIHFSLVALAAYLGCMDASDERDRLYGVMALATDAFLLQVDYSLEAAEIFKRFTECFVRYHKSLDIICFASTYTPPPGTMRPSWVPDWHKRQSDVIPSLTSQSSKSHIGNLRSPTFIDSDPLVYYSACKNKKAVFAFEGSSLQLRGVVVDVIDGLAGSRQSEMVQSSEWTPTRAESLSSSPCSTAAILESVCRCIAFDRSDRFLRYPMPTAEFLRDFTGLLSRIATASKESVPQELLDWFQWTRSLQFHGRSFEDIVRDDLNTNKDSSGTAPNMDEFQQDTFFGRFFDTVVRLGFRLMVSRCGRIGMVVEKAMKGDIVCVLYGCSVPVVLRESAYRGKYTLVGECYLDGCMDGSLLDHTELEETSDTDALYYNRAAAEFAAILEVWVINSESQMVQDSLLLTTS